MVEEIWCASLFWLNCFMTFLRMACFCFSSDLLKPNHLQITESLFFFLLTRYFTAVLTVTVFFRWIFQVNLCGSGRGPVCSVREGGGGRAALKQYRQYYLILYHAERIYQYIAKTQYTTQPYSKFYVAFRLENFMEWVSLAEQLHPSSLGLMRARRKVLAWLHCANCKQCKCK